MSVPDSEPQISLPLARVRVVALAYCDVVCHGSPTHKSNCVWPLIEERDRRAAGQAPDDHAVRPEWHEITARYPVRCRTCKRPVTSAAPIPGRAVVWRHVT